MVPYPAKTSGPFQAKLDSSSAGLSWLCPNNEGRPSPAGPCYAPKRNVELGRRLLLDNPLAMSVFHYTRYDVTRGTPTHKPNALSNRILAFPEAQRHCLVHHNDGLLNVGVFLEASSS